MVKKKREMPKEEGKCWSEIDRCGVNLRATRELAGRRRPGGREEDAGSRRGRDLRPGRGRRGAGGGGRGVREQLVRARP